MLVLSRKRHETIVLRIAGETWMATVSSFDIAQQSVDMEFCQELESDGDTNKQRRTAQLTVQETIKFSKEDDVTLIEVREDRVRLGFHVAATSVVARREVYEALRRSGGGPDSEPGGSPVPSEPSPSFPPLDAEAEPPRDPDDDS